MDTPEEQPVNEVITVTPRPVSLPVREEEGIGLFSLTLTNGIDISEFFLDREMYLAKGNYWYIINRMQPVNKPIEKWNRDDLTFMLIVKDQAGNLVGKRQLNIPPTEW